jgi:DNA-binding SARP family transcriptional activator
MEATLVQLNLFGPPELRVADQAVGLPTRKLMGMLAYLALQGQTPRTKLAELFWDATDERARANLRGELYRLKKTAVSGVLEDAGGQLGLRGVSTDLERFDQLCARGEWAQAMALRRGPLLDGLTFDDAPGFEDWLSLERERLEERVTEVIVAQAERLEQNGAPKEALDVWQMVLERDPLSETAVRSLMRLHTRLGEPARGLERYASYKEFLSRELGLEPGSGLQDLERALRLGQPGVLDVPRAPRSLDDPPLIGRETIWDELKNLQRGLILIIAEAGVGKTRLAQEFARTRGRFVLLGHHELASGVGFDGVIDGLRALRETGWKPGMLSNVWKAELSRILPELEPVSDGVPSAVPDDPSGPARFREAIMQAFLHALEPGGTVIWDDLHWADESSLTFLPYCVRRAASLGLRVIGTVRPEGLVRVSNLERALAELERDGLLHRVKLGPLAEPDVLRLVHELSGSQQGGTVFSRRLHQATHGNAQHLLETLRFLFERGELQVASDGWYTPFDDDTSDYRELTLPESVLESTRRRFDRLGEAARRLAELLALVGQDFTLNALTQAMNWEAERVVDALETLESVGLTSGGTSGYRLAHDLSRAALGQGLSDARRTLLHGRLAEVLSQERPAPGLAAEITRHAEAAGNAELTLEWAERAAMEANERYAYPEVTAFLRRALSALERHGPKLEHEAQLRFSLEDALNVLALRDAQAVELEHLEQLAAHLPAIRDELMYRRGRHAEFTGRFAEAEVFLASSSLPLARLHRAGVAQQLGHSAEAEASVLELLESGDQLLVTQALITLTSLSLNAGQVPQAVSWLEQARRLNLTHPLLLMQLERSEAQVAAMTGQFALALDHARKGERLAAQYGNLVIEAVCANLRAIALSRLGQHAEALEAYQLVRDRAAQSSHPQLLAAASVNLSALYLRFGALEMAHQHALDAVARTQAIGDRRGAVMAAINAGTALVWSGDATTAASHFQEALNGAQAMNAAPLEAIARTGLGLCMSHQSQFKDAAKLLRAGLDARRATNSPDWMTDQAQLALVLLHLGQTEAALKLSSEALESMPVVGVELVQQIPWIHARVLRASGDHEAAQVALERAQAMLEDAVHLVPETYRAQYREAFSFNREIRAAMNGSWPEPNSKARPRRR